ncbi:MAG TPA: 30S ribosomal protein S17 [Anaerolineae bacterium]|nr:30S ribosomal protein S17 [Anaerolineae bacterium]
MTGRRKSMVGTVISNKMDKTVVVVVERLGRHPLYKKVVKTRKRFKAHDADNACQIGDVVRLVESRPLSKEKHWAVEDILRSQAERAAQ